MASSPARALVSALVVTYNHATEISECVEAALAQETDRLAIEVVVVDNASADGTAEAVRALADDRVRLVALDSNTGYAAGVNTAFAHASPAASEILLLNPDCVMDPGCVERLHQRLSVARRAGAAAAMLRNLDGSVQLFARRELGLAQVWWTLTEAGRRVDAARLGGRWLARRSYGPETLAAARSGEPMEVDCPAAACVLVRRALLEPRPMAPSLPLFFNDAELWRRLRADGWRCEVVPAATAAHGYGTSVRRADRSRIRADFVASLVEYARAWGPTRRAALIGLLMADAASAAVIGRITGSAEAGQHARGTLGGLGLPGGAPPWLATPALRSRRSTDG